MDKRKATLTLTEKLNELGYINLVMDSVIKTHLLKNAKYSVFDIPKSGRIRILTSDSLPSVFFDKDIVKIDSLPYHWRGYKEANYFFLESIDKYLVTPVALIGESEEKVLRENFYKNVPEKVLKAFEVLQIPNFIEVYSVYSSSEVGESNFLELGIYRKFGKEDQTGLGDIIQGSKSKRYYLVDKVDSDGDIWGHRFQDEALKIPATGKKDDTIYGECSKDYVTPFKKRLSDISFLDFIFHLPYEDQNIEANKSIFKTLNNVDAYGILQKEYLNGKHFKDYFSILNKESQNKIIENIKTLPNQNKILNSWLFAQGFNVKIDHIELYKQDAKSFIDYFRWVGKELQELIVADLFNCDHTNNEVIEFLEKEYSDLLRDVSFKNESFTNNKKNEASLSDEPKLTSRRGGGGLHKY